MKSFQNCVMKREATENGYIVTSGKRVRVIPPYTPLLYKTGVYRDIPIFLMFCSKT